MRGCASDSTREANVGILHQKAMDTQRARGWERGLVALDRKPLHTHTHSRNRTYHRRSRESCLLFALLRAALAFSNLRPTSSSFLPPPLSPSLALLPPPYHPSPSLRAIIQSPVIHFRDVCFESNLAVAFANKKRHPLSLAPFSLHHSFPSVRNPFARTFLLSSAATTVTRRTAASA